MFTCHRHFVFNKNFGFMSNAFLKFAKNYLKSVLEIDLNISLLVSSQVKGQMTVSRCIPSKLFLRLRILILKRLFFIQNSIPK